MGRCVAVSQVGDDGGLDDRMGTAVDTESELETHLGGGVGSSCCISVLYFLHSCS